MIYCDTRVFDFGVSQKKKKEKEKENVGGNESKNSRPLLDSRNVRDSRHRADNFAYTYLETRAVSPRAGRGTSVMGIASS